MRNPSMYNLNFFKALILIIVIAFSYQAFADQEPILIQKCKSNQLEILPFGEIQPGMNQVWLYFAVKNISSTKCELSTEVPIAWIKNSNKYIALKKDLRFKTKKVIVDPVAKNENFQLVKNIVWFDIWTPKDNWLPAKRKFVKIQLSGIKKLFEVPILSDFYPVQNATISNIQRNFVASNTHFCRVSPIHNALSRDSLQYPEFQTKSDHKIYFDKYLFCG